MMKLMRTIRGIVKTALTWSVAWVPLSLANFGISFALHPVQLPAGAMWWIILNAAVVGFLNGAMFGTVVAVAGRRKTFSNLRLRWIAVCGAAGGATFPLLVQPILLTVVNVAMPVSAQIISVMIGAATGAICAAGSLALARRAPELPRTSESPAIGARV